MQDHVPQADIVGVVALQPAVAVDDGVDGADGFCGRVDLIKIFHDGLLVGNCDIQAVKVSFCKEFIQLILLQGNQFIRFVNQMIVDLRRPAVTQRPSDQSQLHFPSPSK